MKYVTGVHALNIPNSLETCGDWHCSALRWKDICFLESEGSIWGEWGIESGKHIPEHGDEVFYVADDLRAILDIMGVYKDTRYLKGFKNDFLCTDKYNLVFFEKVYMLRDADNWDEIDSLMSKEFMWEWVRYKESVNG